MFQMENGSVQLVGVDYVVLEIHVMTIAYLPKFVTNAVVNVSSLTRVIFMYHVYFSHLLFHFYLLSRSCELFDWSRNFIS